jgi:hypothetical protein
VILSRRLAMSDLLSYPSSHWPHLRFIDAFAQSRP